MNKLVLALCMLSCVQALTQVKIVYSSQTDLQFTQDFSKTLESTLDPAEFQITLDEFSPVLSQLYQYSRPQVLVDLTELAVLHYELRVLASSLSSALFILKDYDYARHSPYLFHIHPEPEHEADGKQGEVGVAGLGSDLQTPRLTGQQAHAADEPAYQAQTASDPKVPLNHLGFMVEPLTKEETWSSV